MKCPYCGKAMEKGVIASSEPINWLKEAHFVNQPNEEKGEFNLARPPFGGRASVETWLCRDCRVLEINF